MELLSVDDFKDSEFGPDWCPFDYLLEVTRVGYDKYVRNGNYFKKKHGDENKRLVFKYFKNNALKLDDLMEGEVMGLKHEKRLNKNNAGLKRKLESKEQEDVGLKLKRSKMNVPVCPNSRPELPENFKEHIVGKMGGSDWLLVIQKILFYSDVNPGASRFSIPFSQIQTHEFLYKKEAEDLNENKVMEVRLLDPSLKEKTLTFKKWRMGKCSTYVLTKMWNWVAKNNQLKIDDVVQLWSFRVESKLCFALVKVNTSVQQGSKEGVCQSKGNEKGASSSGQEEEYGGLYENEL